MCKVAGGRPAAGYFFLRRQEKVTKKKAPPVCRPFGVPSVLQEKAGLRNSPLRGSNSARPLLRFLIQNLGGAQGVFQER